MCEQESFKITFKMSLEKAGFAHSQGDCSRHFALTRKKGILFCVF